MATPADDDVTRELAERGRSRLSGLTLGILGALIAVAGFGGGVLYERSAGATTTTAVAGQGFGSGGGSGGGTGQGRLPGGRPTSFPTGAAEGFVAGTITKVSDGAVIVKQADGTSVTVKTNGSTSVTLNQSGKVSQLAKGNQVVVRGEKAADGSVTAASIAEGQAGGFGFGRGAFGRGSGGGGGAAGGGGAGGSSGG